MVKKKDPPKAKILKGDKREKTRVQLIEAAAKIINEKGFDRTTLEEIAQRAGMTRGAIYNNFKDKEELFLAVSETRWQPIAPPLKPGASLKEQMHILGQAVAVAAKERRKIAVGALSFQLYALTHKEMQKRLAETNKEIYNWAAEQLTRFVPADKLPMPPDEFVKVVHALTDGLLTLHFLTPELITEEIIISAFEALAGQLPAEPKRSTK